MVVDPKVPQVQIRLLDSTGHWYQPASNALAIKAALRAMAAEIRDYPGSYTDDDLREFRRALRALDSEMSKRIGSLVPGDPEWTGEFDADGNPIPRSAFAGNPGHVCSDRRLCSQSQAGCPSTSGGEVTDHG